MLRFFFLSLLVLLLHGCAYLHSLDADLPQKLDAWIAEQRYGLALQTLNYVEPGDKQYKLLMRKKKRILRLAKEFENQTIDKSNKLVRRNKWNAALNNYDAALEKIPDSTRLQNARGKFIGERDSYLKELELKLLVNKGEWLNKNASLHKEVKRVIPDEYRSVPGIQDYEDDLEETVTALVQCTETATWAGRFKLAEQCMALAEAMGAKPLHHNQLKTVKQRLAKANRSLLKEQNKKTRVLINELKQGYSHENLQRANDHLIVLLRQTSKNTTWLKLRRDLKKRVRKGLAQNIEAGRKLYSSGKIEQALDIWLSLQAIDPDNERLQAHIARAKRVLNKLERLQKEGPTVKPPATTSR